MTPETLAAVRVKAEEFRVPSSHLAAMVEVESAGKVFGPDGRPMILFEPHVFYRRLKGEERDRAVNAGLAYPKWGTKPYPKTQAERWSQVERAALINDDAAYESASYGVGQVMGYHWSALGYASLNEFLETVQSGVDGQMDAMLRYCRVNSLIDDLRDGRWLTLARGYNGKGQAQKYAAKLEAAAIRFGAAVAGKDGMLRMGSKGARVRELQSLLNRAGHMVKVDGDFGPATRDALKAFQKAHGLRVDGVYGPKTETALSEFRQGAGDKVGTEPVTERRETREGLGGVLGGGAIEVAQQKVDEATAGLQQIDGFNPWLQYGLTALSVIAALLAIAGIAWFVWGFIRSRKTEEA
jgi:hypothetical protein